MKSNTTAPEAPQRTMVMATQDGFYRSVYCTRGMTFALLSASDFSAKWMVKVGADAVDMIKPADPKRATRPGERPAVTAFTPLPEVKTVKPGDALVPTGDQTVI